MEETDRLDPIVRQDDEFVMPSRVSILLRGLGNAFHINLRVAHAWKPYADRVIQLGKPTDG
jgi:hypothetical protein